MALSGFWKKIFVVAAALMVISAVLFVSGGLSGVSPTASPEDGRLPFQEKILSLIGALEYSAIPALSASEVRLEIDFQKKVWTLRNFRSYNSEGELLLPEDRYGLCAELSTYVFQKLKPLLGDRYLLTFARTTEPYFFDKLESNHIVLLLSDRISGETYLIDPSFHRYGKREAFPDYEIQGGTKDILGAIARRDRDVTFSVEDNAPLFILGDSLVMLSVEPAGGVLDSQNLTLAIGASRRSNNSGKYLFAVRRQRGKEDLLRDANPEASLFPSEERVILGSLLLAWMKGFSADPEKK